MSMPPLSRNALRDLDVRAVDQFGLPTLCLMENAGRGAALVLRTLAGPPPGTCAILCGGGNNGGDAAVLARHAQVWGYDIEVVYLADPNRLKGDAALQFDILKRSKVAPIVIQGESIDQLDAIMQRSDWVVDGLLGTGLTETVRGFLASAIERINQSERPVFALDLPSGLDCDTGTPLGQAVKASHTATFAAPKRGFESEQSQTYTGPIHLIEIGLPASLLNEYRHNPAGPNDVGS